MRSPYLREVMSEQEIDVALSRIAAEIVTDHPHLEKAALVGIRRRGVPLAERLRRKIERQSQQTVDMGELDITFYRDDLTLVDSQPVVGTSRFDFDVNGRDIVLVDDVVFSGRTTRAALESMLDYGRPARVRLAVLIDRGHRELPVQPDYVGKYVDTADNEVVDVKIPPIDDEMGVFLTTRELLKKAQSKSGSPKDAS